MLQKITLAVALTMCYARDEFLAHFYAVRDGAVNNVDMLRMDGGKIYLRRQGCVVHITTAGY